MTLDIRGFVAAILGSHVGVDGIDGGDVQELAIEHGLCARRMITAEEIAADPVAADLGCEPGDLWLFQTPAYRAWAADAPVGAAELLDAAAFLEATRAGDQVP